MGSFNRNSDSRGRGGFGGGKRSFGHGRSFGGHSNYGRGDRPMFNAVCSNCGKDCQVPFNPTGDKPVYCSDCFEKMGGKSERRSFDRPRQDDRNRNNNNDAFRLQLETLNGKLDKIISLLQPQTTEKVAPSETVIEIPVEKKEKKLSKPKKTSKIKTPEKEE